MRARALDETTWPDFAALVERHNGVWGGCWCMGFHPEGVGRSKTVAQNRALPRIKHRRAYLDGLDALPDWRITCFFVDRAHRKRGVAATALAGALEEIAKLGGGTVESFPEDADGRSVSSSFLHNGTLAMFESQGFERTRRIGKHRWVVTKLVA